MIQLSSPVGCAPDFPHRLLVLSWLEALARLHPEESEFLDLVAEKVRTRDDTYLQYGALGLRGIDQESADKGESSRAFQARADAALWGLEVLAEDDRQIALPPAIVTVIVETSLACPDEELPSVAPVVEIAERARWREWTEGRELLDSYSRNPRQGSRWEATIVELGRLLQGP